MTSLGSRAKRRREELGLSQALVASNCGVTQQAIEQMEAGDVLRPRYMAELADILQTTVKWLRDGSGTPPSAPRPRSMNDAQYLGKAFGAPTIPVWGIVDAGDGESYAVNTEDTPIDYITPLPQQEMDNDAYGLLVAGTSMSPALEPGYIACINTRKPVLSGRLCVVELKDGSALIKKFIKRDKGKIILHQYNPEKDLEILEKDAVRILPVVGVVMRV